MQLKKNGASYIMWILAYIVVSAVFAFNSVTILVRFQILNRYFLTALVCLFYFAEIILFLLLKAIAYSFRGTEDSSNRTVAVVIEILVYLSILAVGAAVRLSTLYPFNDGTDWLKVAVESGVIIMSALLIRFISGRTAGIMYFIFMCLAPMLHITPSESVFLDEWSFAGTGTGVTGLCICMLAGFWIMGFFCNKKEKITIPVIIYAAVMAASGYCSEEIDFGIWRFAAWAYIAAMGLQFFEDYISPASVTYEEEASSHEPVYSRAAKAVAGQKAEDSYDEYYTEEKGFIKNPLPVPKRHVKKNIDFAFAPDEDMMDYDIKDIPEDDDFDI